MKNLRRILSLVIALSMLLSFNVSSSAATYTDVADSHKYAEAINLLSGIGIIQGYGNGTFRPEGTITRAEAATIMVRVLALDDNVYQANTQFSDVDSKHWASGYINIAAANGIINGFPEGTFLPDEPVTYEQIVKMVVCAVGHELRATNYGAYPDGYIRAASEAKITKGVSGYVGMEASRGLVAQIVYNALEVEMMDATSFSTGILGTSYSYNGKTLLKDCLEIEKVDAVVTDTYLAASTYDSRDKYITLDITSVYNNKNNNYSSGDVLNFEEGDFVDATMYLGYAVTAYVGEDDNGNDTIFAITLDEGRNETYEITPDKFSDSSDEDVLYYVKKATDKKYTDAELDKNLILVVNGEVVDDNIEDYFDIFDTMTIVNNDKDSYYDVVFIVVFDESEGVEFVVTEIDEDDDYYYFEGDNGSLELDFDDDDYIITVIRDGEVVDVDEISIGDVITCLDASRNIITVYVSSATVTGTISEVDYAEKEYFIKNNAYLLSPAFAEELDAGDSGTFYLNYQGKIAASTVTSTVTSGDYVFITAYDTKTNFSKVSYLMQVVNENGKVETLTFKSKKMKYIDSYGNMNKSATAEEVYNYLLSETTDLANQFNVRGYVGLARVKVSSSGVVSEIYIPGKYEEFYEQTKYASSNNKEYSAKRGTYGNYDLETDTVVFRVNDNEEYLTDAVEVGTVKSMFTDGSNYTFVAYGERTKDIEVLVVTDGLSAVNYEEHAILVTKVSSVTANGEPTDKITGIQDGATVTYIIDPDESFDISVGNIILVSCNAENLVTTVEKVADTTADYEDLYYAFDDVDVPSDEDAGVYAGMVEEKTTKKYIIAGIDDAFYNGDDTAYYLIDYTGRETTYSKSSFSAIKVSQATDSYVIVRTYEDEPVDVFIFKLDAGTVNVDSTDIWDKTTSVETPTESEPETETQAPTEVETQPETESETVTEPETQPETESETVTEPETQPETESETVTEPETQPETESETVTEPETQPETESETVTEPETQPETESETVTEPETQAETESETVTEQVTVAATEKEDDGPILASVEKTTEKETEAPTEAPAEKETEAPTEPVTEIVTEITTEKVTEIETEQAAEKKVTVDSKLAQEVLTLINAERAKAGLPALAWDNAVAAVAEAHCVDMATNGYLDQKNKSGKDVSGRLTDAKVVFTSAAENLAKGNYTAQVIVDAWMKSEKHKVNILSTDFTKVGISVAKAVDGTYYWTVDFIK